MEPTEIERQLEAQEARLVRQRAACKDLVELDRERKRLRGALDRNVDDILRVVRRSRGDLSLRQAATAAGVSRATLNRWLRLRPDLK